MVAATLKEGVEQVAEVGHQALLLACAQHAEVPLSQAVAPR